MGLGTERGSVLFEYVIVVVLILLGGSLIYNTSGNESTLIEMVGVPVDGQQFGIAGDMAVKLFRRIIWMVSMPFP